VGAPPGTRRLRDSWPQYGSWERGRGNQKVNPVLQSGSGWVSTSSPNALHQRLRTDPSLCRDRNHVLETADIPLDGTLTSFQSGSVPTNGPTISP
jgi:hypothetical protein